MSILRGSGAQLKAFAGPRCQSSVCNSRRVKFSAACRQAGVSGGLAWGEGGDQTCLQPLRQAAAQKLGSAPLPAQSHNIHLPSQSTSLCIKASGCKQPLQSSQFVCPCSLLLRTGISVAQGSKGEVQADSAVGLSPLSRQDVHNPWTVTGCRSPEERAGTHLPQLSSPGGLPRRGRLAPHVRSDFSVGSQQAVIIAGDHYPRCNTNTETVPRQAGFPVLSAACALAELGARVRTGNRFEDTLG